MVLKPFDPWECSVCACPAKLSLNPYTGCQHGCLYCYAASYIPRFKDCRPKKDLHKRLERSAARLKPRTLVAMSNSSDPYPPIEKQLKLSRGCLEILKRRGMNVQVVTKSDLVVEDADLLADMNATVAITITTLKESLSKRIEPGAVLPKQRLEAVRSLSNNGIPVSVRLDPLIPGINDSEIDDLVREVCKAGALHIVSSTYKSRPDSLKRISSAFPSQGDALKAMFRIGDRIEGYAYLPRSVRRDLIQKAKESAFREGVTFSTCREGFDRSNEVSCDGSHLCGIIL